MILKDNFSLIKHDTSDGHDDYWFKVNGETKKTLDDKYREQGFVGVNAVVYSKDEDIVGIKRIFVWNWDVILNDDLIIKQILTELVKEIGG